VNIVPAPISAISFRPRLEPTVAVSADDTDKSKLWIDICQPKSEATLAVHKQKVDAARNWPLRAFRTSSTDRILALTDPAGAGKTATLRVLGRELAFDIIEWRNSFDGSFVTRKQL
jgi:cell cycle checkpoint protein